MTSEDAPGYIYDAWMHVLETHPEIKSYNDFIWSNAEVFAEFREVIQHTFEMLLPIRDGLVD